MDSFMEEIKNVTFRNASLFGFQLASNIGEQMEKDDVPPSRWPIKFPLTLKQINNLPKIRNNKIAKKVAEAAKAMWNDMRIQAMEVEEDMKLRPELYMDP